MTYFETDGRFDGHMTGAPQDGRESSPIGFRKTRSSEPGNHREDAVEDVVGT